MSPGSTHFPINPATATQLKGSMKKLVILSPLLLACSAFAAGTPSLTGQWSIHNSIAGNESDQECKFVQSEDNKLAGSCKSGDKEVQITGSVDGQKVTWKYKSDYNGTPLTCTATLDDSHGRY